MNTTSLFLSLFATINPLLVLFLTNLVTPKTDYFKQQFDELLTPLMRLSYRKDIDKLSEQQYLQELNTIYLSAFQYAPSQLNDLILSSIKNKSIQPDLEKEILFLFNDSKAKLLDITLHRNRRNNIYETISSMVTLIAFVFCPFVIVVNIFPHAYQVPAYFAVMIILCILLRVSSSKNSNN